MSDALDLDVDDDNFYDGWDTDAIDALIEEHEEDEDE